MTAHHAFSGRHEPAGYWDDAPEADERTTLPDDFPVCQNCGKTIGDDYGQSFHRSWSTHLKTFPRCAAFYRNY
jgi:hypothetical protein